MTFHPEFPIADLVPAPYNPRRITPEGFERLKESLDLFGVCKPVILNKGGTVVAGHQRIRALKELGVTVAPAVSLSKQVPIRDEIRFNLFHNSVETAASEAHVGPSADLGYEFIPWEQIAVGTNGNVSTVKEMALLLQRYGPWGSVVADEHGVVVANSDYALACRVTRQPLLVYRLLATETVDLLAYLNGAYGVYDYTALGVKSYNSFNAQLERLAGPSRKESNLYEKDVLPALGDSERIIDFGAGRLAYVNMLRDNGRPISAYEPHIRAKGTRSLDVTATIRQIDAITADVEANGLYRVIVLDSVLNSTTSLAFQDHVMATCAALCASDGRLYTATRSMSQVDQSSFKKMHASHQRTIEFLDDDNFGATFRNGVWTLQHFHTIESLTALVSRYFTDVRVFERDKAVVAYCAGPRAIPPAVLRASLEIEFNMEYPGGFHHDRQGPLVELLLAMVAERDAQNG